MSAKATTFLVPGLEARPPLIMSVTCLERNDSGLCYCAALVEQYVSKRHQAFKRVVTIWPYLLESSFIGRQKLNLLFALSCVITCIIY